MPVIDIQTDPENLTITVNAEFAAPIERVWAAYTDPKQLGRFWGPPGWPATFTQFDHRVGGQARYHMTSPEGELSYGAWEFLTIEEPHRFVALDSFVSADGKPLSEFSAIRMSFDFIPTATGTQMIGVSTFDSLTSLNKMIAMGMVEGTQMSLNQLDAVLVDLREYAAGKGTIVELLDDMHVRIIRMINGPRELVWRAHNESELIRQWMLGPDGWEMTECKPATTVGEQYRYSWAPLSGKAGQPFGFEGEAVLIEAPVRAVTTEKMQDTDGPTTLNDLNLYEEDGATLITTLIGYPDKDTRDMILATGMVDGMEDSYARLEKVLGLS